MLGARSIFLLFPYYFLNYYDYVNTLSSYYIYYKINYLSHSTLCDYFARLGIIYRLHNTYAVYI